MLFRFRFIALLIAGFVLLQACDFLFTWLLISGATRADVYESNPLARSILDRTGWTGLAVFKLAITGIALAAVVAVARRRRFAAIRLLAVLCLIMLGVNVYSGTLLTSRDSIVVDECRQRDQGAILRQRLVAYGEFVRLRDRICDDVLAGEIDSESALNELTEDVRRYAPRVILSSAGRLPDPTRRDELAQYLGYHLRQRADNRGVAVIGTDALAAHFADLQPTNDPLAPQWLRERRVTN